MRESLSVSYILCLCLSVCLLSERLSLTLSLEIYCVCVSICLSVCCLHAYRSFTATRVAVKRCTHALTHAHMDIHKEPYGHTQRTLNPKPEAHALTRRRMLVHDAGNLLPQNLRDGDRQGQGALRPYQLNKLQPRRALLHQRGRGRLHPHPSF